MGRYQRAYMYWFTFFDRAARSFCALDTARSTCYVVGMNEFLERRKNKDGSLKSKSTVCLTGIIIPVSIVSL